MKSRIRLDAFIIAVCILINTVATDLVNAQHVDSVQAKLVAKNFFADRLSRSKQVETKGIAYQNLEMSLCFQSDTTVSNIDSKSGSESLQLYYIFNVKDKNNLKAKNGYLIVSADQRIPPVLGYSFTGEFIETNQPPAFKEWMNNYKEQIIYVIQNKLKSDPDISNDWKNYSGFSELKGSEPLSDVLPLLSTTWNQGCYYNDLCPEDNRCTTWCNHVPAGCTAIAMAQIIKYWNYPETNNLIPGYYDPINYDSNNNPIENSAYGWIPDAVATAYQWSKMPNSLNASSSIEEIEAVSKIIFHCGISVQMNYGPNGSGAWSPTESWINYFKYSSDIQTIQRSNYTDNEWESTLKYELDNYRPIWYAGSNGTAAHAFVCDGYQGENFFHFNWGWGGSQDGYFYVDGLTTPSIVWKLNQSANIGIEPPESYKTLGNTDVYSLTSTTANRRAIQVTFSEPGEIKSISIYHNGGTGSVLLGVYSDQSGSPATLQGITAETPINATEGWQTISLVNPVPVNAGQTVWLSWVFQFNPGIRYVAGTPRRAESPALWSGGMPATFGPGTFLNYKYSIYCTYSPAAGNSIIVSPTSITLSNSSGSQGTFNITSNTTWNITDDASWLDVSPLSGSNNGTITVTSNSANTGTSPRSSIITISHGAESKTVTVTQEAPNSNKTIGNTEVYSLSSSTANRRAIQVTFSEPGSIESISIYHNGGTGSVLLGVYADASAAPGLRLGVTAATIINSSQGWQTVSLSNPVEVESGQTVWLSWVFQSNPGIRYMAGTPRRAESTASWEGRMPDSFGPATFANYKYSVYCTYHPEPVILYTISGYVRNTEGNGISGVSMNGLPGNPLTNSSGYFSASVTSGWSGTVTPSLTGFRFIPSSTNYLNVTGNQITNYTAESATSIADLEVTEFSFLPQTISVGQIPDFVSFRLTNKGPDNMESPNTYVQEFLYLSKNIILGDGDDILIISYMDDYFLTSGSSRVVTPSHMYQYMNIPPVATGDYYVFFKVQHSPTSALTDPNPDNNYSVRAGTIHITDKKAIGNTTVYSLTSLTANRRAIQVTMGEPGSLESISVYHNGGTGQVLLAVYADESGAPGARMGVTAETIINSTEGWQTVPLISPVNVNSGQTVWLSWVFQTNPGIRYVVGTPRRAESRSLWSGGMPSTFGAATFANYKYSIYCTYTPGTAPPFLNVSPANVTLGSESGSIGIFNISSNTVWDISDDAAWIDVLPVSGTNDGTVTITANSTNGSTESRTATVTVTGIEVANKTVTVTQEAQASEKTLGNTEVFSLSSSTANRRAIPVTFSEPGMIESVSIYHNGGTGNVLLGVYSDQSGAPSARLGITTSTLINSTAGWQEIALLNTVSVSSGQTVWLSWVFQTNPGIRYVTGTPRRAESPYSWSGGMPSVFGTATYASYRYSVYCTYVPAALKSAYGELNSISIESNIDNTNVYPNPADESVTIKWHNYYDLTLTLTIYDLHGKPVKSIQISPEINEIKVDLSDIEKGMYLFELKDAINGVVIKRSKVIKL